MSNPFGTFVWHELMTTDTAAATAFYASVVGWRTADSGMVGFDYTLFYTGEQRAAGLMAMPEDAPPGMPPCWVGYIGVDDIDATATDLAAKGATIIEQPRDIPGVGRFAVIADPHGAVFSLFWTADGDMGPQLPPGSDGQVGWNELMAGDLDSAWAFYSSAFGWTKDMAVDMGEMGVYQTFGANGGPGFGGMMTKPKDIPAPPYWGYYFNVDAIDAAVERVKAAGGQILMGPMEVPGGGWIINCIDPQGAHFNLVAMKR